MVLAALGGAAGLVVLLLAARPGPGREPRAALAPAPVAAAAAGREPDAPPAAGAAAPPVAPVLPDDLPEPVRRFLESTPYPATSGRLTAAHEDLLFPNRRHERHRPIPDTIGRDPDEVVTWLFTADRWAYVGPGVVHARLEVLRGGAPVPVEVLAASAVAEGRSGPVGRPEPLAFAEADDALVADLPLARFGDHHGTVLLSVRFAWEDGRVHEDALRVFYTPASRVPGRFVGVRDAVVDGSLRIELDVEIDRPGFYRFDANLYGPDGEPVAFALFKGDLDAGLVTVPIEVYGKVLRDAGVPGPYTVGEVRGYQFLDGHHPDRAELPNLPDRWVTRDWPLTGFTNVPHTSAHELHVAELIRDDLAHGIPFEVPAPPVAPAETPPPDDDAEVPVTPPAPAPDARRR